MTPLTYASLCSGIEAAHLALTPLGFAAQWFSDIDPFASALLAHHYPHIPNHGDMCTLATRIRQGDIDAPDLLCAGTPCQSFSTIGQRAALADPRGHLTLSLVNILNACDHARHTHSTAPPRRAGTALLWENVIGVLSARGNAFGHYLAALAGARQPLVNPRGAHQSWPGAGTVYGPKRRIAWRTLDAQYFNLPQQRRRVFLVASPARSRIDPAQVLFERVIRSGHTHSLRPRPAPVRPAAPAPTADSRDGKSRWDATGNLLKARCLGTEQRNDVRTGNFIIGKDGYPRILTPLECERLQGFPDDYTRIPWRGKPAEHCPDTLRYKAIGNAWPVPVIHWIGHRLAHAMRGDHYPFASQVNGL